MPVVVVSGRFLDRGQVHITTYTIFPLMFLKQLLLCRFSQKFFPEIQHFSWRKDLPLCIIVSAVMMVFNSSQMSAS